MKPFSGAFAIAPTHNTTHFFNVFSVFVIKNKSKKTVGIMKNDDYNES